MLISVITVCYNARAYIRDAIESVAAQSWPHIEHIVVDGGSSDGTCEIIEENAATISKFFSGTDRGVYDAMNRGIDMAEGEVIGFLNADDLFAHDGVIQRIASTMMERRADACYGDLVYVKPDDTEQVVRYWRSCPFRPGLFARGWLPPHPTFYVRKDIYSRYGGFDLQYALGNDVELMMRFLERYRIESVYIPETMVKMRIGGISNRSIKNILLQNREILRAARLNGIRISAPLFFVSKFLSRAMQFVSRPSGGEQP